MKVFVRNVLLIFCLAVFFFSSYKMATIIHGYKESAEQYKEITNKVIEVIETHEEEEPPIKVDFEGLLAENKDIVGWIYIETLDISYPILRGNDNNYYLNRNYKHDYNSSGSIFMEYRNSPDFTDANTIIYGHNMYDGSMFGKLSHITKEEHYKKDPVIWILTPEGNYCYKIFSAYVTSPTSDTFVIHSQQDDIFAEYIKAMKDKTEVPFTTEVTGERNMITLSTCTGNGANRFIIQAVLWSDNCPTDLH